MSFFVAILVVLADRAGSRRIAHGAEPPRRRPPSERRALAGHRRPRPRHPRPHPRRHEHGDHRAAAHRRERPDPLRPARDRRRLPRRPDRHGDHALGRLHVRPARAARGDRRRLRRSAAATLMAIVLLAIFNVAGRHPHRPRRDARAEAAAVRRGAAVARGSGGGGSCSATSCRNVAPIARRQLRHRLRPRPRRPRRVELPRARLGTRLGRSGGAMLAENQSILFVNPAASLAPGVGDRLPRRQRQPRRRLALRPLLGTGAARQIVMRDQSPTTRSSGRSAPDAPTRCSRFATWSSPAKRRRQPHDPQRRRPVRAPRRDRRDRRRVGQRQVDAFARRSSVCSPPASSRRRGASRSTARKLNDPVAAGSRGVPRRSDDAAVPGPVHAR